VGSRGRHAERAKEPFGSPRERHDHRAEHETREHACLRVANAVARATFTDRVGRAHLHAAHESQRQRVAQEEHDGGRSDARERLGAQATNELGVDEPERALAEHRSGDGSGELRELHARLARLQRL
jgi:hypothetical protein